MATELPPFYVSDIDGFLWCLVVRFLFAKDVLRVVKTTKTSIHRMKLVSLESFRVSVYAVFCLYLCLSVHGYLSYRYALVSHLQLLLINSQHFRYLYFDTCCIIEILDKLEYHWGEIVWEKFSRSQISVKRFNIEAVSVRLVRWAIPALIIWCLEVFLFV